MSDKPLNPSQSRILNTGLGIGMAGFFQRKLGRQALVLLDFLISTDGSGSYREILHRFTETEGFASDSTVRSRSTYGTSTSSSTSRHIEVV